MSAFSRYRSLVLLLVLLAPARLVLAVDVPFEFANQVDKDRYTKLTEELRCLVCQNQTLADSSADLAQDLRDEIFKMITEGKTNEEIITYLVNRYGDFVLYRPPVNETTWLLWFGPFALLLIALATIVFFIRSQKPDAARLSEEEKKRVSSLLADKDAGGGG